MSSSGHRDPVRSELSSISAGQDSSQPDAVDVAKTLNANSAPVTPRPPQTLYLIAVGGTAMAPLAGLLVERGDQVLGSDLPLYPPMSDRIAALGILVRPGFDARNLPQIVDSVVVGNLAGKDNPELVEALRRGLPVRSMPETIHDEFLTGRHPVVLAGTHGKTTTTALTAWLLKSAGRDPGFLIGGEALNFAAPSAIGTGDAFVLEGDEYSTSYADRGPKFLHYAPRTLVVLSVEFDHADLYEDLEAVKEAFRRGVALVPPEGRIVANGDDANVRDVLQGACTEVVLYGVSDAKDLSLKADSITFDEEGTRFDVVENGVRLLSAVSPLSGWHNVSNALAAIGACRGFGVSGDELARGLAAFRGVRRRLEDRGTAGGVRVLDDFAHHPTAVATTIDGARRRHPNARLWAVFEPRSITAGRAEFAEPYRQALARADGVAIALPYHAARLSRDGGPGALDAVGVARDLEAAGVRAFAAKDADAIVEELRRRLSPGDVVLVMSSGSFGGLCEKLLASLSTRA